MESYHEYQWESEGAQDLVYPKEKWAISEVGHFGRA